jgi:hypothetical protein
MICSQVRDHMLAHPHTAVALLRNLDVVRKFRTAHWTMTNQYIIKNTRHPKVSLRYCLARLANLGEA